MCSRPWVVLVSTLMAVSLSQWGGVALRLSVASMPVAHPGQMAGMCAEVVLGEVELGELTA